MASRTNALIFVSFVINFALTFLSQTGAYGATNAEISRKFQSLVTPAGWTFSIWGIIFSLETVYVVLQLLPAYCEAEEVKRAGPWFVGTSLLQAAWSIAFGMEQIVLAQVLIVSIGLTLWRVNVELLAAKAVAAPSWFKSGIFHVPFAIHFGWLTAAATVGLNLTVVHAAPHAHAALLALAVLSLVVVVLPTVIDPCTGRAAATDPAYALTIAWALTGIRAQLEHPMDKAPEADPIAAWCPPLVTAALAGVATVLASAITAMVAVRAVRAWLVHTNCLRSNMAVGMSDALVVGVGDSGK